METFGDLKIELHETEERLLTELRTLRRGLRQTQDGSQTVSSQLTIGQRIADAVAATMGSWTFIIAQSVALIFWIALIRPASVTSHKRRRSASSEARAVPQKIIT